MGVYFEKIKKKMCYNRHKTDLNEFNSNICVPFT